MINKFFFIFLVGVTVSCNDQSKETDSRKDGFSKVPATREDSLYKEVMEAHDIGMAKMGKLIGSQSHLQSMIDSLNKLPPATNKISKQVSDSLHTALENIKQAITGMNIWMEEFRVDSARSNSELRIRYLEKEMKKVTMVKESILSSLRKADSLLNPD